MNRPTPARMATPILALGLAALIAPAALALDASAWKFTRPVNAAPGALAVLELPDDALDAAREDLADLRLVDGEGRAVPHLLDVPAGRDPRTETHPRTPLSFSAALGYNTTVLTLETGTKGRVCAVDLHTPAAGFLKPVRIEASTDGEQWSALREATPIFRTKTGAENLRITFAPGPYSHLRISVDDAKDEPVPFTGAVIREILTTPGTDPRTKVPAKIISREEKPGVTRLWVDLGAAHLPLCGVNFETPEPLFTRRVSIAVPLETESGKKEQIVAMGSLWNISGIGDEPSSKRRLDMEFRTPGREIIVSIQNGDSPPLAISSVSAERRPCRLLFIAPRSSLSLISGNTRARPPEYDLSALASRIKAGAAAAATAGPLAANPAYREPERIRPAFMAGAKIDTSAWRARKRVIITTPGIQELEPDLQTLCHARADLGDLRLVSGDIQVPYLRVSNPGTRRHPTEAQAIPPPARAGVARFLITLPEGAPPVTALEFKADDTRPESFRRRVRLVREDATSRDGLRTTELASALWTNLKAPDVRDDTCLLTLPSEGLGTFAASPAGKTSLILEVENGDDAPVTPTGFALHTRKTSLLFIAPESGDLTLHFSNPKETAPDYTDLRLISDRLGLMENGGAPAALGPLEKTAAGSPTDRFSGPILWGSLAALVAGLLFAVSRMLPKETDERR